MSDPLNVATSSAVQSSTSFDAWWSPRLEGVPAELRARLLDIVPAHVRAAPIADAVEQLQVIAVQYLSRVLASAGTARDTALDLLALDALVTYLVQAAAFMGVELDAWAVGLMTQLANVPVPQSAA